MIQFKYLKLLQLPKGNHPTMQLLLPTNTTANRLLVDWIDEALFLFSGVCFQSRIVFNPDRD